MRGVATWGYPSREAQSACPILGIGPAVTDPEGSATSMIRCGIPGNEPPKARPRDETRNHDYSVAVAQLETVVQIVNQLPNVRQFSEPMVQWTTICALGAQDRGSNPRGDIFSLWSSGYDASL
jgi:hypothetical protein